MPRQKRVDEARVVYHAINRGNARQPIFLKAQDYEAFVRVLSEGLEKYPAELFSFSLMPNHWHLVLRPQKDGQMGQLLRWVTATHSLRYHGHYNTRGEGHIYQSRYKSFPVQDDSHFYTLCRYVERNPLRAKLVKRAEDWPYGSLYRWNQSIEPLPRILSPWPIPRLANWNQRVNEPLSENELSAIRTCIHRGRPYGDDQWTEEVAERHGIWFTLRPVGRPKKRPTPGKR